MKTEIYRMIDEIEKVYDFLIELMTATAKHTHTLVAKRAEIIREIPELMSSVQAVSFLLSHELEELQRGINVLRNQRAAAPEHSIGNNVLILSHYTDQVFATVNAKQDETKMFLELLLASDVLKEITVTYDTGVAVKNLKDTYGTEDNDMEKEDNYPTDEQIEDQMVEADIARLEGEPSDSELEDQMVEADIARLEGEPSDSELEDQMVEADIRAQEEKEIDD